MIVPFRRALHREFLRRTRLTEVDIRAQQAVITCRGDRLVTLVALEALGCCAGGEEDAHNCVEREKKEEWLKVCV